MEGDGERKRRREGNNAVQVDSVVVAICFGFRFRIHFATFSMLNDSYNNNNKRQVAAEAEPKGEAKRKPQSKCK